MKVLILYYSGVGNTKMVAEIMYAALKDSCKASITSIEEIDDTFDLHTYEALVIGFPTIHASPAKPMMDYISKLHALTKLTPLFLFTTYGLYSANTLRIFAKKCVELNMLPILNKSYRCAAVDGVLIAPFMSVWYKHERKITSKPMIDSHHFLRLVASRHRNLTIPRFKLYSILNYPNKILGRHFSPSIYIHKEKCIHCHTCSTSCPTSSFTEDASGYPSMQGETCIHCYRCIHHCPKKALSLSKKRTPKKTLYF